MTTAEAPAAPTLADLVVRLVNTTKHRDKTRAELTLLDQEIDTARLALAQSHAVPPFVVAQGAKALYVHLVNGALEIIETVIIPTDGAAPVEKPKRTKKTESTPAPAEAWTSQAATTPAADAPAAGAGAASPPPGAGAEAPKGPTLNTENVNIKPTVDIKSIGEHLAASSTTGDLPKADAAATAPKPITKEELRALARKKAQELGSPEPVKAVLKKPMDEIDPADYARLGAEVAALKKT